MLHRIKGVLRVACDVTNPLWSNGLESAIFGPQKELRNGEGTRREGASPLRQVSKTFDHADRLYPGTERPEEWDLRSHLRKCGS